MAVDPPVKAADSDDSDDSRSGLDLSPRPIEPTRPARTGGRKWVPIGILVVVAAAGGVIVTQFLRSAVDYYCNVDEIGERDGCDAQRRLRVQGVVDEGSVESSGGFTTFSMSFDGVSMDVRYRGEPGGIFAECEPVVVHGRLDEETRVFAGDSIEVKHSNEYAEENPGRVDDGSGPNCTLSDSQAYG